MQVLRLSLLAAACIAGPVFAKTLVVPAGPDAQSRLQEALIDVKPGDVVRLGAGRFDLTDGLSLDVDKVAVRGAGPGKTILSFKGQKGAGEGLLVTSDDVVLRDFAVEDSKGDGIKSKGANRIVYHNLRVEWTGGPKASNGAYGVYPVESSDILINRVVVRGASDAGIYVGQSDNIIVRNSRAEFNVAGIEIENSTRADVYGNIATRNTGGILVFDLPNLPKKGGRDVRVFNNSVMLNDTPNFAPPGNVVAGVPNGTGVLVMANSNVHVFGNRLSENSSTNILIVGYQLAFDDKAYQPLPGDVVVRGNRHGRAGYAPGPQFSGGAELKAAFGAVPQIVWDGTGTGISVRDTATAVTLGLTDPKDRKNAQPAPLVRGSGSVVAIVPVVLPAAMEAATR